LVSAATPVELRGAKTGGYGAERYFQVAGNLYSVCTVTDFDDAYTCVWAAYCFALG
jgi:hypothetical protein